MKGRAKWLVCAALLILVFCGGLYSSLHLTTEASHVVTAAPHIESAAAAVPFAATPAIELALLSPSLLRFSIPTWVADGPDPDHLSIDTVDDAAAKARFFRDSKSQDGEVQHYFTQYLKGIPKYGGLFLGAAFYSGSTYWQGEVVWICFLFIVNLPFANHVPRPYSSEMGALDGLDITNTLSLETAFGWRGVLIEAGPVNFGDLLRNRPSQLLIHAAVCSRPQLVHFVEHHW